MSRAHVGQAEIKQFAEDMATRSQIWFSAYPAKVPPRIIGGLLTFESDWSPPLGTSLLTALQTDEEDEQIDLGCVAAHGVFGRDSTGADVVTANGKAATAFLFELLARLQEQATVPMIDIRAYASWLDAEAGLEADS